MSAAQGREKRITFSVKTWRLIHYFVFLPGLGAAVFAEGVWPFGCAVAGAYFLGMIVGLL